MQQPQQAIERMRENTLRDWALLGILQSAFEHLQVKAAELVPGKVVQRSSRIGEMVVFERLGHLLRHGRQPAENPAIFDRQFARRRPARRVAIQIHHRKPRGVPQFVARNFAPARIVR